MFLLAILMLMWSLGVFLYHILPFKKKNSNNHYIREHQKKLKDDKLYRQYLDWCFKHGEPPMDQKGFDSIRDKEKYVKRIMKKY